MQHMWHVMLAGSPYPLRNKEPQSEKENFTIKYLTTNSLQMKELNESHIIQQSPPWFEFIKCSSPKKPRRAFKYRKDQPSPDNAETWYLEVAW